MLIAIGVYLLLTVVIGAALGGHAVPGIGAVIRQRFNRPPWELSAPPVAGRPRVR